jgi:hypothetical protein
MRNGRSIETSRRLGAQILLWGTQLLGAACGRTPLLPLCSIDVTPTAVDFGEVAPGDQVTRSVGVVNRGGDICRVSSATGAGSDPWFTLGPPGLPVLNPGESTSVSVRFSPANVSVPLARQGTLVVQSNDPARPSVAVSLTGRIQTNCVISVRPSAVDFGHVPIGTTSNSSLAIVNAGSTPCDVAGIAIGPGSDSQFGLDSGQVDHFSLAPGEKQDVVLTFHATDVAPPHHRTGNLVFGSTDAKQATVTIPLSADIDIGCALTVAPDLLDFGKVVLNTTSPSQGITLGNDGSDTCQVSGIDFGPNTDPGFALDAGQARALAVAPGASGTISLHFGAFDSAPPHLRTGTLVLQTGNPRAPTASVSLSATVDTTCVEASQWIYTVDLGGKFSRFDPTTLTFTDIGMLQCPTVVQPNSMAVDQNAVAWVDYDDGSLFKVDTATSGCEATSFRAGQYGLSKFGMGFVFEPSTGVDTLYIAGTGSPDLLATVSFPSLVVTPIGPLEAGDAELTGTGDGSLWGFVPNGSGPASSAVLVRIDPTSGKTLESYSYPTLIGPVSNWAVKFWGGSFWIFLNTSVYEVPRATPQTIRTVIADTAPAIVGAGVSTCAPLFQN